jgi:hypothetical protein
MTRSASAAAAAAAAKDALPPPPKAATEQKPSKQPEFLLEEMMTSTDLTKLIKAHKKARADTPMPKNPTGQDMLEY